MRITKYKAELDVNRHNVLVKEFAVNYACDSLNNPVAIATMFNSVFGLNRMAEEYVYMLSFSTAFKVLGAFEISHGSIRASLISPREIFIRLLLSGAASFMICHNHPSGICIPSGEDIGMTKKLKGCADLMGVQFTDHIIIGDSYYSFKEHGLL